MNINLQQLRYVREIVRQDFNLTRASEVLFTSQPGVSKTILDLESSLGFDLFERHGKRIRGLTKEGTILLPQLERILQVMDGFKDLVYECKNPKFGRLTIATTHTQARYVLPQVIAKFREKYPDVRLSLIEGAPSQIAQMVLHDHADIAVATERLAATEGLDSQACYEWTHQLLFPANHPLVNKSKPKISDIAEYPIITYEPAFAGRAKIDKAFIDAHMRADVVLEAVDADVIKTYVELGLGVGILAGMALNEAECEQKGLIKRDAGYLFGKNTTYASVKIDRFLREYERYFIELLTQRNPQRDTQRNTK